MRCYKKNVTWCGPPLDTEEKLKEALYCKCLADAPCPDSREVIDYVKEKGFKDYLRDDLIEKGVLGVLIEEPVLHDDYHLLFDDDNAREYLKIRNMSM